MSVWLLVEMRTRPAPAFFSFASSEQQKFCFKYEIESNLWTEHTRKEQNRKQRGTNDLSKLVQVVCEFFVYDFLISDEKNMKTFK